jgi:hypothetical protein
VIEDIRVFSTIPDETPSYLAEELLFEFHYVGRLFLFCRPPTDLPNLKRLHFAFRTGGEGPLVAKDSVFPTEEKKEGLCCIQYNADLHQKLPKLSFLTVTTKLSGEFEHDREKKCFAPQITYAHFLWWLANGNG